MCSTEDVARLPFMRAPDKCAVLIAGCQVYAIALYVEAERAAKELGVRKRGGFFDDDRRAPSNAPPKCHFDIAYRSL